MRQQSGERSAVHPGAPLVAEPVIRFDNISWDWGRRSKRRAVLKGIDLEVAAGSAICIQGGNGAGKTTLLRIASGILAPNGGSVTVDGIQCGRKWSEYHSRVGFLSAGDRGLYPRLSVKGHFDYVTRISLLGSSQRRQAVAWAVQTFGLQDLLDRRSDRMSQGQRQRLRLALAFVHSPKVLLLDEPRNSLDATGLDLLSAAVAEALARGAVVIWCAPTGEDQPVQFDRKFVLTDGKLHTA